MCFRYGRTPGAMKATSSRSVSLALRLYTGAMLRAVAMGAITVAVYLCVLVLAGGIIQWTVQDPLALPIWGFLLSFPGSVIVGTPGHIYVAVAFNSVALFVTVALFTACWKNRS
jgi:hypothetical protein